jgi:hypothetical protein
MLAMNLDEAEAVAQEFLKGKTFEELTDRVLVPALSLAEEDRHRGRLDEKRQQFILQNTRLLVEEIGQHADEVAQGRKLDLSRENLANRTVDNGELDSSIVLIPARDEADEMAAWHQGPGAVVRSTCGRMRREAEKQESKDSMRGRCSTVRLHARPVHVPTVTRPVP